MSHSKRNTSLAFFTSYERSLLRGTWGSQSARLTRDSFLPFGSCQLCLLPSKDPVACNGGPAPVLPNSSDPNAPTPDANPKKRKRLDEHNGGVAAQCHIFCRECIIANLLAQKKELKRLEREREAHSVDAADADLREDEAARARAVEDFERVQMGLEARHGAATPRKDAGIASQLDRVPIARRIAGTEDVKVVAGEDREADHAGNGEDVDTNGNPEPDPHKKRKFELDEDELMRIAAEEHGKARQALSDERTATAKARELPSFWVPAETPSNHFHAAALAPDGKKAQPLCPGSVRATAHPLSLKTLIPVVFNEEEPRRDDAQRGSDARGKVRSCPACSKPLTNASHAVLAKPCGHVVCGSCVEKFVLGESDELGRQGDVRCFVCAADLGSAGRKSKSKSTKGQGKEGDEVVKDKVRPGLMLISSEGTGFAAGPASNMVKKSGTAFQC